MLSQRLVSLIEAHADEMARQVVSEALTNPRTPHGRRFPPEEMQRRAYDVYHNLGRWLGQQAETAIDETYSRLGRLRANEGIPLEEVVRPAPDQAPPAALRPRFRSGRLRPRPLS